MVSGRAEHVTSIIPGAFVEAWTPRVDHHLPSHASQKLLRTRGQGGMRMPAIRPLVQGPNEGQLAAQSNVCIRDGGCLRAARLRLPEFADERALGVWGRVRGALPSKRHQVGIGHPVRLEVYTFIRVNKLDLIEVCQVEWTCLAQSAPAAVLVRSGVEVYWGPQAFLAPPRRRPAEARYACARVVARCS